MRDDLGSADHGADAADVARADPDVRDVDQERVFRAGDPGRTGAAGDRPERAGAVRRVAERQGRLVPGVDERADRVSGERDVGDGDAGFQVERDRAGRRRPGRRQARKPARAVERQTGASEQIGADDDVEAAGTHRRDDGEAHRGEARRAERQGPGLDEAGRETAHAFDLDLAVRLEAEPFGDGQRHRARVRAAVEQAAEGDAVQTAGDDREVRVGQGGGARRAERHRRAGRGVERSGDDRGRVERPRFVLAVALEREGRAAGAHLAAVRRERRPVGGADAAQRERGAVEHRDQLRAAGGANAPARGTGRRDGAAARDEARFGEGQRGDRGQRPFGVRRFVVGFRERDLVQAERPPPPAVEPRSAARPGDAAPDQPLHAELFERRLDPPPFDDARRRRTDVQRGETAVRRSEGCERIAG